MMKKIIYIQVFCSVVTLLLAFLARGYCTKRSAFIHVNKDNIEELFLHANQLASYNLKVHSTVFLVSLISLIMTIILAGYNKKQ